MLLCIVIIVSFCAYFNVSYDVHHRQSQQHLRLKSLFKHSHSHTCFILKYKHNNNYHYRHHMHYKKKSSIGSRMFLSDSYSYEENQNSIQEPNKSEDNSVGDSGIVLIDRKKSVLEDSYHARLELQRWFLLTHNMRPDDVTIITTSVNDIIQLINELYRQILINIRILESDINQDESMRIIAFPYIQIDDDDDDDDHSSDDETSVVKRYNKLAATVIESFTNTNIKSDSNHTINFYINHQYQQPLLLCRLYTYRDVIKAIDFDDIDQLPVVNDDDDLR